MQPRRATSSVPFSSAWEYPTGRPGGRSPWARQSSGPSKAKSAYTPTTVKHAWLVERELKSQMGFFDGRVREEDFVEISSHVPAVEGSRTEDEGENNLRSSGSPAGVGTRESRAEKSLGGEDAAGVLSAEGALRSNDRLLRQLVTAKSNIPRPISTSLYMIYVCYKSDVY